MLKSYKTTHFGDERECLRSVFGKWIEATSRKVRKTIYDCMITNMCDIIMFDKNFLICVFVLQYPTTWWGLVKLLDDAELSSIGDELEKVAADDPKALSV